MLLSGLTLASIAQITDNEAQLRAKKEVADSANSGWKFGGMTSLQFTNTKLYNWAAGGDNSIAINAAASAFANYLKGPNAWDNSLFLGYGLMRQGSRELENGDKRPYKKTDDKIEFVSKYGRLAFKNWYYAALLDFKTQMTDGKNYTTDTTYTIVSKALAPAYLTGGIGLDYKPNNYFSAYISPITARFIFVNDQDLADLGSFGVTPAEYDTAGVKVKDGEKFKYELGGYVRLQYTRTEWNAEFMKNVGFTTKLNLFSNYLDNPQNIDVDWETLIALKINKYITVNFNTHLLYDDDTKNPVDVDGDGTIDVSTGDRIEGPKVQFKEILAIGFLYNF